MLNQHLGDAEERWPRFAPVAIEAGFHSVHALPMRLRGDVIGALNLFRADRAEMDEADVITGQALADVATITILQHRAVTESRLVNEQLSHALNSRIVIEQAKGSARRTRASQHGGRVLAYAAPRTPEQSEAARCRAARP